MTWNDILNDILSADEMITMKAKLDEERKNFTILPEKSEMFNAFMLCPYEKTRIVILGQD
jgi:uracil-DNA glycosylase